MLNKLTIVLTLRHREDFTLRWMDYMNTIQCGYKILIADGGDDESLQNHLENYKNYPNINYDYIKYPYDRSLIDYYKKLCDITDKVKTPYIMYADNDDFIILDYIDDWIVFLDNNQDFVSCGGDSATLSVYSKDNKIVNECYGNNFSIQHNKNQPFSIEGSTGVERACDFLRHGNLDKIWFIWYDILRTESVKITHKFLNIYEFKDVVSLEIYNDLSWLMLGKSKKFDSISYIRQTGTSECSALFDKEFNVLERFVNINAYNEIIDGLTFINKDMTANDKKIINKAFSIWLSKLVRRIYFPSDNKTRLLLNNFYIILNNFMISKFINRCLYSFRNLISKDKVYFLRIKSIENSLSVHYNVKNFKDKL
jgi:glycosyltransferase domain-containing protein